MVLVLGSGWGSHALSKVVDTELFDVVVVSPTNHFCFTPMLPSAAVGTVEFRSVLEPVRVSNPTVTYLEAEADEVDLERKVARCTAAAALSKAGGEAEEEGGGEGQARRGTGKETAGAAPALRDRVRRHRLRARGAVGDVWRPRRARERVLP